ncbi:cytochrome c oxidase subunit II [Pseudoroseomonas deserti]|uniref:cytochrome-c oxidase n=1 Tax=Teichococcus deserti TaxID=1817963 RepID=A0A1V2H3M4_9PROT|nr:cytochrome c oxidase subunit II [Pseudoroseomonas deserti]ONG53557.1 cytochrome c oxidase subunit II [Pseudoroseomonas deserti]
MRAGVALLLLPLAGCTGAQSALDPQGSVAQRLGALFWLFVAVLGLIWLAVLLVLAVALRRRAVSAAPSGERRAGRVVTAATLATALVVAGLTLASYRATHGLSDDAAAPLVVQLRGYQWWWQVTYPGPGGGLVTANEIRLPAGRAARIELSAADVIHSFWVPNLAGKQDMIPGRDNALTLTPLTPGRYRAQCAEFCGLQHAHMALMVVVEPPEDFAAWMAAQRATPAAPADPELAWGRRLLEEKACGACHALRGSRAAGQLGPDLTHLASRDTLAAGMLPMTPGSIAAWIADPQQIKPGNAMPRVELAPDELRALTAYLASLR